MIDYAQRFKTPEECAAEARKHVSAARWEFIGGVLIVGGFVLMMVYSLLMWLSEPSLYGTY